MSDKKEINTAFIEQVVTFIKDNNSKELNDIIADLHVADIAEILKELSVSHAQFLYQIIDEEKSAEILVELNDDLREGLLTSLSPKEIADSDPKKYFMPGQFENPANPEIHFKTTGPEIWNDCDGEIDVLVAGVGTGGTITGVSRYIKQEKGKSITSVAVEPSHSPVITQTLNGEPVKPGPHKIQGIGAGFIPKNLDLSVIDKVSVTL